MKVLDKAGKELSDGAPVDSKRGRGTVAGFQLLGISMRPVVRVHRPKAHPFTALCEQTDDPSVLKCPDLQLVEGHSQDPQQGENR